MMRDDDELVELMSTNNQSESFPFYSIMNAQSSLFRFNKACILFCIILYVKFYYLKDHTYLFISSITVRNRLMCTSVLIFALYQFNATQCVCIFFSHF